MTSNMNLFSSQNSINLKKPPRSHDSAVQPSRFAIANISTSESGEKIFRWTSLYGDGVGLMTKPTCISPAAPRFTAMIDDDGLAALERHREAMWPAVPGPQFTSRKCSHVNACAAQGGVGMRGALVRNHISWRGSHHVGTLALIFIQDRREEMPDRVGVGWLTANKMYSVPAAAHVVDKLHFFDACVFIPRSRFEQAHRAEISDELPGRSQIVVANCAISSYTFEELRVGILANLCCLEEPGQR